MIRGGTNQERGVSQGFVKNIETAVISLKTTRVKDRAIGGISWVLDRKKVQRKNGQVECSHFHLTSIGCIGKEDKERPFFKGGKAG